MFAIASKCYWHLPLVYHSKMPVTFTIILIKSSNCNINVYSSATTEQSAIMVEWDGSVVDRYVLTLILISEQLNLLSAPADTQGVF